MEDGDKTERGSMPPPEHVGPDSPHLRRNHAPSTPGGPGSMPFSPRHSAPFPPQGMGYNGMPPVSPAQFYGNSDHVPSPMRMGGMGIPMDSMGGLGPMGMSSMGGMGPMGMNSPDLRRGAMRRGVSMNEDGFTLGMH